MNAGGRGRAGKAPHFAGVLERCRLCPRECGANRAAGQTGFCGAGATAEVFRYGPHGGEEPPVSGERGSGTVFFSRCTMRCLYCQNYPWSQEGQGTRAGRSELSGMLLELAERGCHNWNLVSPTPWLPMIAEAMRDVEASGVSLPVVYNTSGFESVETLAGLEGWADVYLTDLRYSSRAAADEGSAAPEYPEAARAALREMWRQAGPLALDEKGVARSGVICRLLVLPGMEAEAVGNLRWLAEELGTDVAVSVMSQYEPLHRAAGRGDWGRRVSRREYESVCVAAEELGFRHGWFQEYGEAAPEGLIGACMAPGGDPAGIENGAKR